jgi:hypothetical protein
MRATYCLILAEITTYSIFLFFYSSMAISYLRFSTSGFLHGQLWAPVTSMFPLLDSLRRLATPTDPASCKGRIPLPFLPAHVPSDPRWIIMTADGFGGICPIQGSDTLCRTTFPFGRNPAKAFLQPGAGLAERLYAYSAYKDMNSSRGSIVHPTHTEEYSYFILRNGENTC